MDTAFRPGPKLRTELYEICSVLSKKKDEDSHMHSVYGCCAMSAEYYAVIIVHDLRTTCLPPRYESHGPWQSGWEI